MTKIFNLEHSEFYKEFDIWRKSQTNEVPVNGVYIVKSINPIERCLKPDPDGILYVGQGNILSYNNRIGKLVNSFNGEQNVHEAGSRYLLNKELQNKFPTDKLVIEITLTEDPIRTEKQILINYFSEYGDVPPLNRIAF